MVTIGDSPSRSNCSTAPLCGVTTCLEITLASLVACSSESGMLSDSETSCHDVGTRR